ncbi:Proteasome subunit beta type-2-A [Linum perenne]
MECVFGLVGNDFAIVAADSSAVHSILVHKSNEDKIMVLDSHKLVAASGEPGDRFAIRFHCFSLQGSIHGVYTEERVSVPVQEWNSSNYSCCCQLYSRRVGYCFEKGKVLVF